METSRKGTLLLHEGTIVWTALWTRQRRSKLSRNSLRTCITRTCDLTRYIIFFGWLRPPSHRLLHQDGDVEGSFRHAAIENLIIENLFRPQGSVGSSFMEEFDPMPLETIAMACVIVSEHPYGRRSNQCLTCFSDRSKMRCRTSYALRKPVLPVIQPQKLFLWTTPTISLDGPVFSRTSKITKITAPPNANGYEMP